MLLASKTPYGIKLEKSKQHTLNLSGTTVTFSVPPYSINGGLFTENPFDYNIYDHKLYNLEKNQARSYGYVGCYNSGWSVYTRKLLAKCVGNLDYSIVLFYDGRNDSVFAPGFLEESANNYLVEAYGPKSDFYLVYKCRLDWRYSIINTLNWLSYKVIEADSSTQIVRYITPISDNYYISVVLRKHYIDPDIDLDSYFDKVINNIMSTVKINLSPDAKRQQQAAKEKWPNDKPTKFLPEMTWPDPAPPPVDPFSKEELEKTLSPEDIAKVNRLYGVDSDKIA